MLWAGACEVAGTSTRAGAAAPPPEDVPAGGGAEWGADPAGRGFPTSATVWVTEGASSVIVSKALRRTSSFSGVKAMPNVHSWPAPSVPAQLLAVTLKSSGSRPFISRAWMVIVPVPTLRRVTVREALAVPEAWLPKSMLVGLSCTKGVGTLPSSDTTWLGVSGSLSVKVSTAVRIALTSPCEVFGLYTTSTEQLPPP